MRSREGDSYKMQRIILNLFGLAELSLMSLLYFVFEGFDSIDSIIRNSSLVRFEYRDSWQLDGERACLDRVIPVWSYSPMNSTVWYCSLSSIAVQLYEFNRAPLQDLRMVFKKLYSLEEQVQSG